VSTHAAPLRLPTTTRAPAHTKPSAIALPIPLVPPVTIATRPWRSKSSASLALSMAGPYRPRVTAHFFGKDPPVAPTHLLLPARPYASLAEYVAAGGGDGLRLARERGTDWVLDELQHSGLRGRGGAGFTTAQKWRSVRSGGDVLGNRYVVANGAEGEPGTFK